jgi:hypothetical protein
MGILEELFKKKSLVILPMILNLLFGCAYTPINKDFKKKKVEPSKTEDPIYDFKDFINALGKRNFNNNNNNNNNKAKRGIEFLKKVQGLIEKKNLKVEMDLNNGKLRKEDLEIMCKNFPKKEEINKNTFYDFKFAVGNDSLDEIAKYFGYSGNENKFFKHNPNLKSKLKEGGTINVRAHNLYLNGYTDNVEINWGLAKTKDPFVLREERLFFGQKGLANFLGITLGHAPKKDSEKIFRYALGFAKEFKNGFSISLENVALDVISIIDTESNCNSRTMSNSYALGLAGLTPDAWLNKKYGKAINPFNTKSAVQRACQIYLALFKNYSFIKDKKLREIIAITSYNTGEKEMGKAINRVRKQGKKFTATNILNAKNRNGKYILFKENREYYGRFNNKRKKLKGPFHKYLKKRNIRKIISDFSAKKSPRDVYKMALK